MVVNAEGGGVMHHIIGYGNQGFKKGMWLNNTLTIMNYKYLKSQL